MKDTTKDYTRILILLTRGKNCEAVIPCPFVIALCCYERNILLETISAERVCTQGIPPPPMLGM